MSEHDTARRRWEAATGGEQTWRQVIFLPPDIPPDDDPEAPGAD